MRALALAVVTAVAVAVLATSAHAAIYNVSASGTQELTWSVSGNDNACEVRQGVGNGKVAFSFKSARPGTVTFNGSTGVGSVNTAAKGTITGQLTQTTVKQCDDFPPDDPFSEPTDACGATKFELRVDLNRKGRFLYINGPSSPGGSIGHTCPFPVGGRFDSTSERENCGEGSQQWERSYGVSTASGAGMLASKVPVSAIKSGRKSFSISKRETVACTIPSQYAGGVKVEGTLRYTLTFKRLG